MMKSIFSLMLAILLVSASFGYINAIENVDYFSEALHAANLTVEDITWDIDKLSRLNNDPFRLYWFNELWSNPLRIPQITRQMTDRISLWNSDDTGNELKINYFYGVVE